MRAGYTAFLSSKVTLFSCKNYGLIQEKGKIVDQILNQIWGPSKKGLFCVRQKEWIYRISMFYEILLVTAVKQGVPVQVPSIYREHSQFLTKCSVDCAFLTSFRITWGLGWPVIAVLVNLCLGCSELVNECFNFGKQLVCFQT